MVVDEIFICCVVFIFCLDKYLELVVGGWMGLFVRLFEVSGCDVMMLDGFIEVMEDWCVYFR